MTTCTCQRGLTGAFRRLRGPDHALRALPFAGYLGPVLLRATFARKRREEPSNAAVIEQRQQAFRTDFQTLTRIALDDDVHRRVDDLLARHPLRGADAVHLASALLVRDVLEEPFTFACADLRLVDAARAEGLDVAA